MSVDKQYADLIDSVMREGQTVYPRNGERIRLVHPPAVRFRHTPLVVVRKTAWKSAIREWEWFLSGSSNVNDLHPSVHKWWQPWADESGEVRFNYSQQLRKQRSCGEWFDQIAAFVDGIRRKPHSSRHVISTWYSPDMYSPECPITNCHGSLIQAFVHNGVLDLVMTQRSADLVCGVPHNWIQYWAFLLWLSHRTGTKPGEFVWQGGDVHLYAKHKSMACRIVYEQARMIANAPQLVYAPTSDEFKADDFTLSSQYTPVITESVEMVV